MIESFQNGNLYDDVDTITKATECKDIISTVIRSYPTDKADL